MTTPATPDIQSLQPTELLRPDPKPSAKRRCTRPTFERFYRACCELHGYRYRAEQAERAWQIYLSRPVVEAKGAPDRWCFGWSGARSWDIWLSTELLRELRRAGVFGIRVQCHQDLA